MYEHDCTLVARAARGEVVAVPSPTVLANIFRNSFVSMLQQSKNETLRMLHPGAIIRTLQEVPQGVIQLAKGTFSNGEWPLRLLASLLTAVVNSQMFLKIFLRGSHAHFFNGQVQEVML